MSPFGDLMFLRAARKRTLVVMIGSALSLAVHADVLTSSPAQNVVSGAERPAPDQSAPAPYVFGNPKDKPGFTIWASSSRAGLTFTDAEPVDIRVRAGAATESTVVDYVIRETDGPWQTTGRVILGKGTVEQALPVELPRRGLYQLNLSASSGGVSSSAETWIAVVFPPHETSEQSPWGMFGAPQEYDPSDANGARDVAVSARLLGASWKRLIYPYPAFEDRKIAVDAGPPPTVRVDVTDQLKYAQALRDQNIFIMADVHYVPKVFSSKPDDSSVVADSGTGFAHFPPSDYRLWEQFAESLASKYRGLVQVWQIGNEPDLPGIYWRGTPEQLVEFIQHSAAGLRKGDSSVRIAAPGLFSSTDYADRLFELGLGKYIDILTVHYTEEQPEKLGLWQNLVRKHNLKIPVWNSEERRPFPIHNLAHGQGPFIKFLHVEFGYPETDNLVRKDLTVRPAGVAFSVGAHNLGAAKWTGGRDDLIPGWYCDFFQRADEKIVVIRGLAPPPKLMDPKWRRATRVTFDLQPQNAGQPVTATDLLGRSRDLAIRSGRADLDLPADVIIVNGARRLEIAKTEVPPPTTATVVEAEAGRWSPGWFINNHAGFSDNTLLEIWSDTDPGSEGYWAETPFRLANRGTFEVIFDGLTLEGLVPGRSNVSPFAWSIDGGTEHVVDAPLSVIKNVAGAPQGISILETLDLGAGDHVFRLRLLRRRDTPDTRWSMWFDALALRPKVQ